MTLKPRSKNGMIELRRRVPVRYASVEDRKFIWVSLGTDSASDGKTKADAIWQQHVQGWEAMLAGDTAVAQEKFDAAREIARSRGFNFRPASKVLEGPLEDLLRRVEAIPTRKGKPDGKTAAALLGTVPDPGLKVSKALDLFWELTSTDLMGKSPDQARRTRNPVIKAVRNFIEVVGDKILSDITRDDMLDFRQWWAERLELEDLTANSANKDLGHLGKVLMRVNELKRLNIDLPLGGLKFKQGDAEPFPPFSAEWIKKKLLAPGALAGLNTEARCILLGMVNTGYRPSEGAALLPAHIHLEGAVPFIQILPDGREIKTKTSKRVIPLTGVSLEALREGRIGFPRYRDNPGLSATINSFLRENKLILRPLYRAFTALLAVIVDPIVDVERLGRG